MFDFLFNSIWGWLGIGGTVIAASLAVAWFLPPFRRLAISVAGIVAAGLIIYAKGASDAKRREREKSAAAVAKRQADYSQIDGRPDDINSAAKRMRDGKF